MATFKQKPLECIFKKPVSLRVGDLSTNAGQLKSGCSVIDVLFPGTGSVDIGEMSFKNNYAASITVKAKVINSGGTSEVWKTCVKTPLMPHPHFETGSQDYFRFTRKEMHQPLSNVVMMRLILKQPSPHWNSFGIEELQCFSSHTDSSTTSPSLWLTLGNDKAAANNAGHPGNQGLPNIEEVAASLQQLWAMTEEVKGTGEEMAIGRFDVDGSYDINLLSYT